MCINREAHITVKGVDTHSVLRFCNPSSSLSFHRFGGARCLSDAWSIERALVMRRGSSLFLWYMIRSNPSKLHAYDPEIDMTYHRLIRSPRSSEVANNSHNDSIFAPDFAILKSNNADFDSDLANSNFDFGVDISKFSLDNMDDNNQILKELATPNIMCQLWCIRYPKLEQAQS
ncbi:hypothetical protein CR513_38549, partial [Mucuna pruriens]